MPLVFAILFNILLFSIATFSTTLIIEKYYNGRLKWFLVPSFTVLSGILIIKTDIMLKILHSLTRDFTIEDFGLILLGGIITGIFFAFL